MRGFYEFLEPVVGGLACPNSSTYWGFLRNPDEFMAHYLMRFSGQSE